MNPRLALDQFDEAMRRERKALATRRTYCSHLSSFARFRLPAECQTREEKVSAYLSHLALNRSATHQRGALNAIVCFYRLMGSPIGKLPDWVRPRQKQSVPTWVTMREARAIIALMREPANEIAMMLIGSGLRISEALRLRIKDVDLERATVTVRGGKGGKDRVVMLARSMIPLLERRIEIDRAIWLEDRARKRPGVHMPDGLERKSPRGGEKWPWFWLWPAPGESRDPDSGIIRRHHRCAKGFAKVLNLAVTRSGVPKRVTAHAFRHGFATAYLIGGGTVPELSELLGHANIETTDIYTHCLPQIASRAGSPLDAGEDQIIPIRRAS